MRETKTQIKMKERKKQSCFKSLLISEENLHLDGWFLKKNLIF